MCQNYRNDCWYFHWPKKITLHFITTELISPYDVIEYFKRIEEEDDLISNTYDPVDSPHIESEDSQWTVLPVASRLELEEEALKLINNMAAEDDFFGDVVPDPDPEDVAVVDEVNARRLEEWRKEKENKEVAESFVAAFEAWAYDDPEIGVAHLEEEEYHTKPWSFESQETQPNGNYMELEPEYIANIPEPNELLSLILEPDDAILVRYALMEATSWLETQIETLEDYLNDSDKFVSTEIMRRGKYTLLIIADMIDEWLESL